MGAIGLTSRASARLAPASRGLWLHRRKAVSQKAIARGERLPQARARWTAGARLPNHDAQKQRCAKVSEKGRLASHSRAAMASTLVARKKIRLPAGPIC